MPTILIVPDIHGKREVLAKAKNYFNQADYVIQLGDIVDSENPDCSDEQIWQIFLDWHQLKQKWPQKFILLWGNHELAYLKPEKYCVPKHRPPLESKIQKYFQTHSDLQIAWEYNFAGHQWLLTHAGVTQKFVNKNIHNFSYQSDVAAQLQVLFDKNPDLFWADDSPVWVRDELMKDPLAGYNQIVGHTPLTRVQNFTLNNQQIFRVDTWHYLRGTTTPKGTQNLLLLIDGQVTIV